MTAIDVAMLRRHIGTRGAVEEDVATEAPLKAIVATFDLDETAPRQGEAIPPGWHIGYFLSMAKNKTLATDGLPTGAGVLPKLPLPRRMYAGTRITFHAPIQVGDALRREIELTDLQVREGGTGVLIVTTQTRRISTPRGLAVTEEGDTVFREAVQPGAKSGIPKRDEVPAGLPWRQTITPDPVSLFRFSAITLTRTASTTIAPMPWRLRAIRASSCTGRSRSSASSISCAATILDGPSAPSTCGRGRRCSRERRSISWVDRQRAARPARCGR